MQHFHVRSHAATEQLFKLLQQTSPPLNALVLDLGSGLGGPAHFLASNQCRVVAVEKCSRFIEYSKASAPSTSTPNPIQYIHGDINDHHLLRANLKPASVDVVWLQHVCMFIHDPPLLLSKLKSVLKQRATICIHEVFRCSHPPPPPASILYPLPFADSPTQARLVHSMDFEQMLNSCGFSTVLWNNVTDETLEWYNSLGATTTHDNAFKLSMGERGVEKARNMKRNIQEGQLEIHMGIFEQK